MPTPLAITDIDTVTIATTRGGAGDAWRFTFKTVDDVFTFGYIEDSADSFSDDEVASELLALKIEATLGSAANFAIQNGDMIQITGTFLQTGFSLNIRLPANSGSLPFTLYVDSDGNTWNDAALTSPAGGVITLSDSLTISDSMDNDEYEFRVADALNIEDGTTFSTKKLSFRVASNLGINDLIRLDPIKSLVVRLADHLGITENVRLASGPWTAEGNATGNWVPE